MSIKQVIRFKETNSVEVTWVNDHGQNIRCHSYAHNQMDALRDDLGVYASEYENIIFEVLNAKSS